MFFNSLYIHWWREPGRNGVHAEFPLIFTPIASPVESDIFSKSITYVSSEGIIDIKLLENSNVDNKLNVDELKRIDIMIGKINSFNDTGSFASFYNMMHNKE